MSTKKIEADVYIRAVRDQRNVAKRGVRTVVVGLENESDRSCHRVAPFGSTSHAEGMSSCKGKEHKYKSI